MRLKTLICRWLIAGWLLMLAGVVSAGGMPAPAYPAENGRGNQYAAFPKPLSTYEQVDGGVLATLKARAAEDPFNVAATVIFLLAILHTFSCGWFTKISHHFEHLHREQLQKRSNWLEDAPPEEEEVSFWGTVFHFLGEVEAVFGLWVLALAAAASYYYSWADFRMYIGADCKFTEPLFVVVIMAIAASRPVLRIAERAMAVAASLGGGTASAWWMSVMVLAPLLGSVITEPAAMTIGALLLAKKFYACKPSSVLAYGSLGLLFVNVSVGGTLTSFAAPPVLMVAGKWGWDTWFMLTHFGWKAAAGILLATGVYYLWFRKELGRLVVPDGNGEARAWHDRETPVPAWVTLVHLGFLGFTVWVTHYAVLFVGGFLFFQAFVMATRHHQNAISMRNPMLVGFFLAGLVIHGGCQSWWIEPIILSLQDQTLMFGAAVLTAFNDNAAITYLASQVDGISDSAKYAVVAGAVVGGGLTVIANAPNPAGQNILGRFFEYGVSPLKLVLGALLPTVIVYICLAVLPSGEYLPNYAPPEKRHQTPALELREREKQRQLQEKREAQAPVLPPPAGGAVAPSN